MSQLMFCTLCALVVASIPKEDATSSGRIQAQYLSWHLQALAVCNFQSLFCCSLGMEYSYKERWREGFFFFLVR